MHAIDMVKQRQRPFILLLYHERLRIEGAGNNNNNRNKLLLMTLQIAQFCFLILLGEIQLIDRCHVARGV